MDCFFRPSSPTSPSANSTAAGRDTSASLLQPAVPSLPQDGNEFFCIQPSHTHFNDFPHPLQLLPADGSNRQAAESVLDDTRQLAHAPFLEPDWDGVDGILSDPFNSHQPQADQQTHHPRRDHVHSDVRPRPGVSHMQPDPEFGLQPHETGGQQALIDACMLGHDLAGPSWDPGRHLLNTSNCFPCISLDRSVPQLGDPGQRWQQAAVASSAPSEQLAEVHKMHREFRGLPSLGSAISRSGSGLDGSSLTRISSANPRQSASCSAPSAFGPAPRPLGWEATGVLLEAGQKASQSTHVASWPGLPHEPSICKASIPPASHAAQDQDTPAASKAAGASACTSTVQQPSLAEAALQLVRRSILSGALPADEPEQQPGSASPHIGKKRQHAESMACMESAGSHASPSGGLETSAASRPPWQHSQRQRGAQQPGLVRTVGPHILQICTRHCAARNFRVPAWRDLEHCTVPGRSVIHVQSELVRTTLDTVTSGLSRHVLRGQCLSWQYIVVHLYKDTLGYSDSFAGDKRCRYEEVRLYIAFSRRW